MPAFPSASQWWRSSFTTWNWKWPRRAAGAASTALAAAVFAALDVADAVLCFVYAFLDGVLEDSPLRCYCHRSEATTAAAAAVDDHEEEAVSDTLYAHGRRSAVRDALLWLLRRVVVWMRWRRSRGAAPADEDDTTPCKWRSPRWSDCACKSCVAWRGAGEGEGGGGGRLHVVVKDPADRKDADAAGTEESDPENAIFVHGFTSSSSFWAETVFRPESSSSVLDDCRLFAVDLLGFGRSPKPANCMYRVRDHVEAIERSLIVEPQSLMMSGSGSFHLVAHSMGCIIALALAAKHPTRVKSITLVAPPYFLPCEKKKASQVALNRLAEKKLWPPLLFGSAVMSWYEHVGRTVCLLVCKNHLLWEWLLTLFLTTGNFSSRGVDFRMRDLTKHTHHSAWHTMHNVICGGAALQDRNLDAVAAAGIPVLVVHGADDQVVPVECSRHLKAKLPRAIRLRVMDGRDHATVVLGRERGFAEDLKAFWCSAAASRSPG